MLASKTMVARRHDVGPQMPTGNSSVSELVRSHIDSSHGEEVLSAFSGQCEFVVAKCDAKGRKLNKEELKFESVELKSRSYK